MVRWGENWGLVGDGCTGEAWRWTRLPVCCLDWDKMFVCCPTLISVLISSSLLFLINPSTLFLSYPLSRPPLLYLLSLSDLIWRHIKDGCVSATFSAAVLVHTSVLLWQAMYQLAPDEKRRDCGLNVLDTYFNNGVRHSITELWSWPTWSEEMLMLDAICFQFFISLICLILWHQSCHFETMMVCMVYCFILNILPLHLLMTLHMLVNKALCMICGGM